MKKLSFLVLSGVLLFSAQASDEPIQQESEVSIEWYLKAKQSVDKLATSFETILQVLSQGKMKLVNPELLQAWCFQYGRLLRELRQRPEPANMGDFIAYVFHTQLLAQALDGAIKDTFRHLPPVSDDIFMFRGIEGEIDDAEVDPYLEKMTAVVDGIESQVAILGLAWYNRGYSAVREIFEKLYIPKGVKIGLGLTSASMIAWYFIFSALHQLKMDKTIAHEDWNPLNKWGLFNKDGKLETSKNNTLQDHLGYYIAAHGMVMGGRALFESYQFFKTVNSDFGVSSKVSDFITRVDAYLRGSKVQIDSGVLYVSKMTLEDPRFAFIQKDLQAFKNIIEFHQ